MIDFKLYLITDRKLVSYLPNAVEQALNGGCRAVQLREKDMDIRSLFLLAKKIRVLTEKYSALLFINDRLDIALSVEADGVHLGQKSIPLAAAKEASGGSLIIGVSTHNMAEAVMAQEEGADFITVGPIYETNSKAQYGMPLGIDTLRGIRQKITIPIFAVGGIKTHNIHEVMSAGADGIALISGIFHSPDIKTKTEEIQGLLK